MQPLELLGKGKVLRLVWRVRLVRYVGKSRSRRLPGSHMGCLDIGSWRFFQALLCNSHPWSSNFFFLVTKVNDVGMRAVVAFVRFSGKVVGVCKPGPGAGLLDVRDGFCGGVEVCTFSDVDV